MSNSWLVGRVVRRSARQWPVPKPLYPVERRLLSIRSDRSFASRPYSSSAKSPSTTNSSSQGKNSTSSDPPNPSKPQTVDKIIRPDTAPQDWDENPNLSISAFSELPSTDFGVNQHMIINDEFKEALRMILWQFKAPIRYAFAYGSGVFPQTAQGSSASSTGLHPKPSNAISTVQGGEGKMIDFIFGVSYTQHWHSLNLQQHRDHYSAVGSLGSWAVSNIQDKWGTGVYFNPYVTVNGTLIKYGVVNLDTLCTDLSEWQSLYLAGRLQKPVKILRDDPRVRLANQVNLLSAVRTALLLLPEKFSEHDLYSTIAGISYMGDPRMALPTENKQKVNNIVTHQLPNFRRLYAPLVENLPNVRFQADSHNWSTEAEANIGLVQDMDPKRRGNMVRRLPKAFREKMYFAFQSKYAIPRAEFNTMLEASVDEDAAGIKRREGGIFEQRVGAESPESLRLEVSGVIRKTIRWPSIAQSAKSALTAGIGRTWRYLSEKNMKYKEGKKKDAEAETENKEKAQ